MSLKIKLPRGKAHRFFIAKSARINILHGSVRSGKTIISILKWIWIIKNLATGECLMVGKTERTLLRNVINPMLELLPKSVYHLNKGSGELTLYGKRIYLVGANDERAENKIRGMTLQYAYVDEGTIIPESFIRMLLSRLSEPGAELYLTTNPDSPYHWLKTDIIDIAKELGAKIWHFTLDDNPYLDPGYVAALKKEYSGLWFRRYILGEWCLAEGVVYPMWDEDRHLCYAPEDIPGKIVAVDYGISNPAAFLLGGIHPPTGRPHVIKEYYHDSVVAQVQKTDAQLADDLLEFVSGHKVRYYTVDPSATSFIVELRNRGLLVKEAINDVIPGIQAVSTMLESGDLLIDPSCENLRKEFSAYVWDTNAQKRGIDAPKKKSDHAMDALRYFVMEIKRNSTPEVHTPRPKEKQLASIPRHRRQSRGRGVTGW